MFDIRWLRDSLGQTPGNSRSAVLRALAGGLLPLAVAVFAAFLLDRTIGLQLPVLLLLLAVCYSAMTEVPGAGLVSAPAVLAVTAWTLYRPGSLPFGSGDPAVTLYLQAGASVLLLLLGGYHGLRRNARMARLHEEFRKQAVRDPLTGLFNRRWFEDEIDRLLISAERYRTPLALLLLEIDDFKRLNEKHGRAVGDKILSRVADLVRDEMRASDLAARPDAETLAVALPGHDSTAAIRITERLRKAIMHMANTNPELPAITISIGIASYPADGLSLKAVTKLAGDALNEAKRRGRDQVHIHGMTLAEISALPAENEA